MASELRRQKRLHLDLPMKITLLDEVKGIPSESEGKLYDLSAGGCAFVYPQEIPIGTRVQVKINLDEALSRKFNKKELTARGAICRIQHRTQGQLLSVRFFK
jgi:c-di-GMP-binding flagellar brake protein YcgR